MITSTDRQATDIQKILAEHPFFKSLELHYRLFIADCATPIMVETGNYLAYEGEISNKFYLIRQGQIEIGILTAGHGFTKLQLLNRGDLVGWSWLMPPHYWRFGARTVIDTDLLMFDGKRIREKCEINHDFGYELMKQLGMVIAERLRIARMILPH